MGEQELFDAVAHAAVPSVADWAAVHVPGRDGVLELRSLVHPNPARVNVGWEAARRWPLSTQAAIGPGRVLRTRQVEGGGVLSEDELLQGAGHPDYSAVLSALGFLSYLSIPLRSGTEVLGALTVVTAESGRVYASEDHVWAAQAGEIVGAALRNLWRESRREVDRLRDRGR